MIEVYNNSSRNANELTLSQREVGTTSFDFDIKFLLNDLISHEVGIVGEIRVVRVGVSIIGIVIVVWLLVLLFFFHLLFKNRGQLLPDFDLLQDFCDFAIGMLLEWIDVCADGA